MIIYDGRHPLRSFFAIRGTALESIWPILLVNLGVSTAITVVHQLKLGGVLHELSLTPFSLIGLALSIFLGFRNNACYDRFWEGRKLWGALVNTSRTLTRQLLTLLGAQAHAEHPEVLALRLRLVRHVMAWVHALRCQLRGLDPLVEVARFLPPEEVEALRGELNVPAALSQKMADELAAAWRRGWLDTYHLSTLEAQLTALTDIQGGCERIRSTPLPMSYTLLTHRIVGIYTFTLPFALVSNAGWATPVAAVLVAYAFFGLDEIGGQIEDPFGTEPNDLPLDALSKMIEANLRQRLGEDTLPAVVVPDGRIIT